MVALKIEILLLLIAACSTVSSSIIGMGIELREKNVVGELLSLSGAKIYADLATSACVTTQGAPQTRNRFAYYENTQSFYRKIGTLVGLSASLQSDYTLGFTLDSTTNSISGYNRTVKGNALEIMATSTQEILMKSCSYWQPLDSRFVQDLKQLPTVIKEPWKSSSWAEYDRFLHTYGSHIVSGIAYGSSISQTSFSQFSYSYDQYDFEVNSCLSMMGPTEAGMVNVSLCAGVTQTEIDTVSKYSMSNSLVINGGNPTTRNKLLQHRTADLITQFMNEANYTKSPIYYTYTPIWEIIQSHGSSSNDDFIKAVNMEQYYLGYLNYGCNLIQAAGMNLQQFNHSAQSSPGTPRYECTLQAQGCHSEDSCHYRLVRCKCEGDTCVRYKTDTLDSGLTKDVPYINQADKWYWQGCDWKHKGSVCECKSENKVRFIVWSGDNKGDLGPRQSANANENSFKEKQEL